MSLLNIIITIIIDVIHTDFYVQFVYFYYTRSFLFQMSYYNQCNDKPVVLDIERTFWNLEMNNGGLVFLNKRMALGDVHFLQLRKRIKCKDTLCYIPKWNLKGPEYPIGSLSPSEGF